jgi:glycine cleavage system H protein
MTLGMDAHLGLREDAMTRAQVAKKLAKNALLYVGLAVVVVAAIPLLAGLAWGVRLMIPVLLLALAFAVFISPAFRRWFMGEADNSAHYHGVAIPTDSLWVHPAHSWANVELSAEANIGADALALTALGPVTAVQAPKPGSQVRQGQTIFTLLHGERRLDVKAPLSGTVADVNEEALARPALLAESPYGAGWVVKLEGVALGKERASLKRGSSLRQWWRGEVDRLIQRLGTAGAVPTMADGGVVTSDLSGLMDDGKWKEIAAEFLGQIAT